MTDGTPAACMQKTPRNFWQEIPGVMAQYVPGLFSTEQKQTATSPHRMTRRAVKNSSAAEEEPYG